MKFLPILLVFGLILFSGCKKGKANFTLKGVITDATFDTSLTGGKVYLYEVEAGGGATNLLGSATIGSDGAYSFTFPRNASESYTLSIRKDNYFEQDISIPLSDLTIEEDNIRNYSTTAKSWAALRFVSTNAQSSVTYLKQQGKTDCAECCPAESHTIYGPIDTTYYCPNDGNTIYSYSYSTNGQFGIKQATTVAFDTATITLSF